MIVDDTLENRVSAEGRAAFAGFLTSLQYRNARTLKVLHVARTAAGFVSCDFNVSAATLPALGVELSRVLAKVAAGDVIPVSPDAVWWDFWCGDWIGRGAAYFTEAPRERYLLMIRGTVQPEDAGLLPGWVMIGEPQ